MITITTQPNVEPCASIADFETGGTFKYSTRYYFFVEVDDEDENMLRKAAVNLETGEELAKYKHGRLYPVDLVMTVVPVE